MAIILRENGTEETTEDISLKNLQEIVGGYIEVISLPDGRLLIMDEEGKLKGKGVNPPATLLVRDILSFSDVVVGDAVLLSVEEAVDF